MPVVLEVFLWERMLRGVRKLSRITSANPQGLEQGRRATVYAVAPEQPLALEETEGLTQDLS